MEDEKIVALYWERNENAIEESRRNYGSYLRAVAFRILSSFRDAEEVENDTLLSAWNAIPPHRPLDLRAFLGKICREASLDRWRASRREKRGSGQVEPALEELGEIASDAGDPADAIALRDAMNAFLAALPADTRTIFLKRYWYFCGIKEIARETDLSESAVKMRLARARADLRDFLEKEGFDL